MTECSLTQTTPLSDPDRPTNVYRPGTSSALKTPSALACTVVTNGPDRTRAWTSTVPGSPRRIPGDGPPTISNLPAMTPFDGAVDCDDDGASGLGLTSVVLDVQA